MTTTTAKETTHTPGPWGVSPDGVCVVRADAVYQKYTDENGKEYEHPDKLIALPYSCGPSTREGNARLIAAAPDLLAALEELAALERGGELDIHYAGSRALVGNAFAAARAAIAKATDGSR